jgi:endonuclease III
MSTRAARKAKARKVLARLRALYPRAECELVHSSPLELAVGAILSAQCTDKRVNQVTPALFRQYRTARDWAETPQDVLEGQIRSTGFFRNKAKNIRALGRALDERHGGALPVDFDALVRLPGIGRKTANLLMVTAFGQPGIIVDTHCKRVSKRLGLTDHTDPEKVEWDLRAIVPETDWSDWSHRMVFHGRYCCFSRTPNCDACPLPSLCPHFRALRRNESRSRTPG